MGGCLGLSRFGSGSYLVSMAACAASDTLAAASAGDAAAAFGMLEGSACRRTWGFLDTACIVDAFGERLAILFAAIVISFAVGLA